MNDEKHLIKTLARESEIIATKEAYLSEPRQQEAHDSIISGWSEQKNISLSSFFPLPNLNNPLNLRHSLGNSTNFRRTQNLSTLMQPKLIQSPSSILRLKLKLKRNNDLAIARAGLYKISNISLNDKIIHEHLSKSVSRKPRLHKAQKKALMSLYFPQKKQRKSINNKSTLAEVDELLKLLQPESIGFKKKVVTSLRSKSDLRMTFSKKGLNHKNSVCGLNISL